MINWTVMGITWIRFNKAIKVQGYDRKTFLPSPSKWQPFIGYWTAFWAFIMLWVQGYGVFIKGNWSGKYNQTTRPLLPLSSLIHHRTLSVATFIFNYGIVSLHNPALSSLFAILHILIIVRFLNRAL